MSSNKERGEEALKKLEKELKARERAESSGPIKVAILALAAIVVIAGGIWFLATQDSKKEDTAASETSVPSPAQTPDFPHLKLARSEELPDTVSCNYSDYPESAKKVSKPQDDNISTKGTVTINLDTNQGSIGMELDRSVSPCSVNAIEHLAKEGYYDDTTCHRLTVNNLYVLQCGDPTATGTGIPGFQIPDEYPASDKEGKEETVVYPRGTIALAKGAQKNSSGSQFFLNYQDSPLPPDYSYIGKMSDEGLKTVESIAAKGTADHKSDGAPAEEVRINKAKVE